MTINLNINGKNCRLRIDACEEKDFRDAQKLISGLIGEYRCRFKRMTPEEILTRVALDLGYNYIVKERELGEISDML